VIGLLAATVALLAGWAGLPSLGQVAPFLIGAYTAAVLARSGVTIGVVQIGAAAMAGALFAAVSGLAVLRTRATSFLMVTMAVGELSTTAASQWTSLTGGTDGLAGMPAIHPYWHSPPLADDRHVYWYVLAVTIGVVATTLLVLRSPTGLLLAGVRDNETRMRASGHPVGVYLLVTFIAAGALAGISGALLITIQRYVSPTDGGFDVSALVLLAVIIGGTRSIAGAFAGAALLVVTRDWLAGLWPGHAPLLLGSLLIVAVYAAPDGIAGLASRLRRRWTEGP